jgi:hypothetical protein
LSSGSATAIASAVVVRMGMVAPRSDELSGAASVKIKLTAVMIVVGRRPGRATARNGKHHRKYQSCALGPRRTTASSAIPTARAA